MVSSKYYKSSSLLHSRADPVAFRIVLRQEDGFDAHQTREFDLELDSKFAIGRASKNISKGYLLPAKHNVYIDSPVVSREHAILTADATSGTPQVYITDTKSMHGTQVNGTPLIPHIPKQLFNGDKLQFGVNVNRNESKLRRTIEMNKVTNDRFTDYFVAFKYTFNAELSNPEPFSRGFTVPEAESEEEELGFAQAGRGSQLDPLILDDSDAESDHDTSEEHEEHAEHSVNNNTGVTLAQLEDEEEVLEIDTSSLADEEDDAANSVADDLADSDAASSGSAPDYSLESPLVHEAQCVGEVEVEAEIPSVVQCQATPVVRNQPSVTSSMLDFPGSEQVPDPVLHIHPEVQNFPTPAWQGIDNHVTFPSSMFDSTIAPPLPPRPSQKRQRIWDEPLDEEQGWSAPSLFDPALDGYTSIPANDMLLHSMERLPVPLPAADRIQTPPPTVPANIVTQTSPSETRRTGVSILEIPDEQPPTPTSINSRKRSADDAFEEDTEEVIAPDVAVRTVEQVTSQPQRPIAQPKSILRRALHAAKVMVPATALGAVFTVGALTALPESFFTVA